MLPIVTPAQMQTIDQAAKEPFDELIERAGWHVARVAREMLGGVYGRRVVVIAGPGNNGKDAHVAARVLQRWGVAVELFEPGLAEVPLCDLVIDGAFGTGMNRPYDAPLVSPSVPVLSIDIPSGLDGLTGEVRGQAVRATRTVTFAALKPGLLLPSARAHVGEIEVVDIGLDVSSADAHLLTTEGARELVPSRSPDAHKWNQAVWVIGGSAGMYGAPLLAAQAAQRTGTGMVWCGLPGQRPPALATEIVFSALQADVWHESVLNQAYRFGSLVLGCGLGREHATAASVAVTVTSSDLPIVIDADGLHCLTMRGLHTSSQLRDDIVLTPHDGEYRALMGDLPGTDRFSAARALAEQTGATTLLKGPLTIVASPAGRCIAVAAGDERLATAGTGDVLAGVIGSYLAAGMPALEAAALGAWMHGTAAIRQRRVGMVASDLLAGLADVTTDLARHTQRGSDHASN